MEKKYLEIAGGEWEASLVERLLADASKHDRARQRAKANAAAEKNHGDKRARDIYAAEYKATPRAKRADLRARTSKKLRKEGLQYSTRTLSRLHLHPVPTTRGRKPKP